MLVEYMQCSFNQGQVLVSDSISLLSPSLFLYYNLKYMLIYSEAGWHSVQLL